MASKHPQEVWGKLRAENKFTRLTSPRDRFCTTSLMPVYSPLSSSRHSPFSTLKIGPLGSTFAAARASNQLIDPQREIRLGVMQQQWVGAKLWHRTHP